MRLAAPFVLLHDARAGLDRARLYRAPRRVLTAHRPAEVPALLAAIRAWPGAAAGFLSYGAGAAFEPAAAGEPASPTPLAWFGLFDGHEEIEDVAALLPDPAGAWTGAPEPEASRAEYRAMFDAAQALIRAGDLYQLNLTFRARVPFLGDPLALYAGLRRASAAVWSALVATGTQTILSLSPELFFTRDGDALVSRPMKGTARRHADPAIDLAVGRALAADAKQRAENLMIVDLMRNDLSRVAVPGSVAVPELFAVERYPTVHQLTSKVTATLAPARDAVDVLSALFPCGSITGAPKVRAMQAIAAVERGSPRGAYTGAIGRIDADGSAAFNVAIRTLTIDEGADHAVVGIGGGIVADSRVDDEWDEAMAKAAFLAGARRCVDLLETMAFDPDEGVLRIERHLERLRASAVALGFVFDRHSARNELQAATFRLSAAARVRLLMAQSGVTAIEIAAAPPAPDRPLRVALAPLPVGERDWRLRHKTSDRRFYDDARAASGADEVLFFTPDGRLTEGSFTSLFVPRGDTLVTPRAGPLLPGVLRGELLDTGKAVEGDLVAADLRDGLFVGNALRGLMRATLAVAQ
ncbi:para-aminobenzoate synthetase/4-amino-4-deoxychorismate lyase [Sphingomonas endophytica]|uniref:Probable branched-chain-amino-acid aminotransferase n=1 Tax=Sphingomonas endophytica TaxID=869719 RepID=A0A7X0MR07_9SPHN|nr:aminodeoxychorismate synthase component I [Sphingomonas endophytica]MBB6505983.1 para-aminobenzoate synthetase/4-amino-4-deoxychorismate lyase [Sphingomonas endophytica]